MDQIPVPAVRAGLDKTTTTAIKRARKGLDTSDLPIYQQTVSETGVDPDAPVTVRKPHPRELKEGRTLTALVFASLKPDGTYNKDRFIPFHITNTSELPTVKPKQADPEEPEAVPVGDDAA